MISKLCGEPENLKLEYMRDLKALMQAKAAGKMPGCHYGGITLPDGKRGFAVYRNGKAIGWYSVWGKMP